MNNYDKFNEKDIERYGKLLENKCLKDFQINKIGKIKDKGDFNKIVEENYFGIRNNNEQEPDFKEVGVELKVTPLKKLKKIPKGDTNLRKKKGFSMKERTVLTLIDYKKLSEETWETNSLVKKAFKILFCFYIYEKSKSKLEYIFDLVSLWYPTNQDIEIIKDDWKKIQNKVLEGKAHEISEGDTLYLGACTKGDKGSVREQPYSNILAKQRAFSFKRSYMDTVYEQLLEKRNLDLISIKEKNKTLEETLDDIFKKYIGKSVYEISFNFNLDTKAKHFYTMLTNKILNVECYEKIEEFKKAGIILKTVRIDKNKKPLENISFPNFKISELLSEEEWESSELYDYLNKKFLFVAYIVTTDTVSEFKKLSKSEQLKFLKLEKYVLWSMSDEDLEKMKNLWDTTREIIKTGVILEETERGVKNNLPKIDFNGVGHVRPHGKNGNDKDTLPDGREITKQCFWLNAEFIQKKVLI